MNLNALEKIAREVLNGKATTTANTQLSSAEQRALMSASWKVTPGGAAAGTFAAIRPNQYWG